MTVGEADPAYYVIPPYPLRAGVGLPDKGFVVRGGVHRGRMGKTEFVEVKAIRLKFNTLEQEDVETLRVTTHVWFDDSFYYIHRRWISPQHGVVQQSNQGLVRAGGFNIPMDDVAVKLLI